MAENSIPKQGAWYERNGAQIEMGWMLLPAGLGWRLWLLHYEGALLRQYLGYRCFWMRGWVRILGFTFGAGIFLQFEKIDG